MSFSNPLSDEHPPRSSIAGEPSRVRAELDDFEASIDRFLEGRIPEATFLEYRLRHGVYGQRQDGVHMLRSKLPLGLLSPEQLEAFADLTEAYSSGVAHLTTRQDIQVHFVPLERTPDLMRVLADAEMTSREACGNVVRNVTASELAGVQPDEAFDVTAHGFALAQFLLRHPDGQSLGRKFKITLSGSFDPYFNTGPIHDIGATAMVVDGQRGFHVMVGGGLGAVPHEAKVLAEFVPEEELLPLSLSILRVFAAHGEKKKRAKARMKFLVAKWGIDKFREAVETERAQLAAEGVDRGEDLLRQHLAGQWADRPLHPPAERFVTPRDADEAQWLRTNVLRQQQPGYATVRVRVPRGDLVPSQLRGLAALLRRHSGPTLRIAADQSLVIRFVPFDRLPAVRDALADLGLGRSRAGGLGDTVTCPGADSCKLGITSPRAIARHMEPLLDRLAQDPRLERLRIKISGCPNSCAQQQTADIGLFGAARTIDGKAAPHYIMFVGGRPGGHRVDPEVPGYGINVARIPALRTGEVIQRLAEGFLTTSEPEEDWTTWAHRTGRANLRALVEDLVAVPGPGDAPEFYRKVGTEAPFEVVRGVGECAGEVVLAADLLLLEADRKADAATAAWESRRGANEVRTPALEAMLLAARALLATQGTNVEKPEQVAARFRAELYEPGYIYEATGAYFLSAWSESPEAVQGDRVRRLATEAGLFVEEVHAMTAKMNRPEGAALIGLGRKKGSEARS